MRNTKKKIGLITGLLGLCATVSVAFAAFTGQLTINGTADLMGNPFKMVFVNADGTDVADNTIPASSADVTGDAEATDITVSADGTQISAFNVDLYKKDDSVTYKFSIKNTGGTIAYLSEIAIAATTATPTGLNLADLGYSLKLTDPSDNVFLAESVDGTAASLTPDGAAYKEHITVGQGDTVDCELTVAATGDGLFAGPTGTEDDTSDDNVRLTLGAITINWTSERPTPAG